MKAVKVLAATDYIQYMQINILVSWSSVMI